MKRIGNIYTDICSIENLTLAEQKASKGKGKQKEIRRFQANREKEIADLHKMLVNNDYRTSPYHVFKIYEPKEREISKLCYRDRVVDHAIMNYMEAVFMATFTADTYSCIKRRGVHKAAKALKRGLKDREGTKYCLKLDIRKFYPNIDHDVTKQQLRRKVKDNDLLALLDERIDSAPGMPIGSYLSQFLSNFYLTGFDRWIKQTKRVKYYYRYADDMIIFSDSKEYLHQLLADIREYLEVHLKLSLKGNYQVFPVAARGVDVLGYVFFHTHVLIRKGTKRRCCRMLKKNRNPVSIASYLGWMKHANCRNLENKLKMRDFKELKIAKKTEPNFSGEKIKMERILNRVIEVHSYKTDRTKIKDKEGYYITLQIVVDNVKRVVFVSGVNLQHDLEQMTPDCFPFKTIITKPDGKYEFTSAEPRSVDQM